MKTIRQRALLLILLCCFFLGACEKKKATPTPRAKAKASDIRKGAAPAPAPTPAKGASAQSFFAAFDGAASKELGYTPDALINLNIQAFVQSPVMTKAMAADKSIMEGYKKAMAKNPCFANLEPAQLASVSIALFAKAQLAYAALHGSFGAKTVIACGLKQGKLKLQEKINGSPVYLMVEEKKSKRRRRRRTRRRRRGRSKKAKKNTPSYLFAVNDSTVVVLAPFKEMASGTDEPANILGDKGIIAKLIANKGALSSDAIKPASDVLSVRVRGIESMKAAAKLPVKLSGLDGSLQLTNDLLLRLAVLTSNDESAAMLMGMWNKNKEGIQKMGSRFLGPKTINTLLAPLKVTQEGKTVHISYSISGDKVLAEINKQKAKMGAMKK